MLSNCSLVLDSSTYIILLTLISVPAEKSWTTSIVGITFTMVLTAMWPSERTAREHDQVETGS